MQDMKKVKSRPFTCDLVSTEWTIVSLFAFHILIARSAVPAPEAKRLFCQGHQASAFTAAWCSLKVDLALSNWPDDHSFIKLSLPPEAKVLPNKLTEKNTILKTPRFVDARIFN